MKIYTKKGDQGKTQLLGGSIVDKNDSRLNCYGSIDELNAYIGHVFDQDIKKEHKKILLDIQNKLFNLGSIIASDGKKNRIQLPEIKLDDIVFLEQCIDEIEITLPALKNFILPSGHKVSSLCHIARTVCRRAERELFGLYKKDSSLDLIYLKFLNRLSDYLFVLSRSILYENKKEEVLWQKN